MSEPTAAATARQALGEELAAYRVAAGYTQARFAHLTGYSRSTVANVETGRQRVPRMFWERCDTALRTAHLLTGSRAPPPQQPPPRLTSSGQPPGKPGTLSKRRPACGGKPQTSQRLGTAPGASGRVTWPVCGACGHI